jgi:iron complex outermembrane recepter protein
MNTLAQEKPSAELEEIVVTATRREESLQHVAASLSALSGDYLQSKGITDFSGLTKTTAGLFLEQPEGAVGTQLRMRGVGTRPSSPIDSAVGVLQDGVYQIRPGFAFQEMMDVERVEVLRGPQGTLFGKNTISGVVKISTNNPDLEEFAGRVQGVAGNYDDLEARGVLNVPIVEGTLAAGWLHRERLCR